MTTKLLSTYKQQIQSMKLIPGSGGCFELSIDGKLIYSKLSTGQFPDEQWVLDQLKARLEAST